MNQQGPALNFGEASIECPMCKSRSWTIFQHRVQCCRCGLCYATPNICALPTVLMQNTVPSLEVVKALEIFDGQE